MNGCKTTGAAPTDGTDARPIAANGGESQAKCGFADGYRNTASIMCWRGDGYDGGGARAVKAAAVRRDHVAGFGAFDEQA